MDTAENTNRNIYNSADYLAQLLKDKKQLSAFPNVFLHSERLLDEEINKVRVGLFQKNVPKKEPLLLPEPDGVRTTQTEKVYVPVKDHPDFNFVGRILGPRGTTVKELEKETGCKIMVRGKGSMRDKKKEEQNRGKPNWEHLTDELHVLVTVEDTPNRAIEKLKYAVNEINKLLVPAADGEDELKKKQLMELAIMNGTYRDTSGKAATDCQTRILGHPMALASPTLRSPITPLGVPLILTPRMTVPTSTAMMNGGGPPPLIAPNDTGLLYSPYPDYHQYAALTSPLLTSDYQAAVAEHLSATAGAGGTLRQRRHLTAARDHPYQRAGSLS